MKKSIKIITIIALYFSKPTLAFADIGTISSPVAPDLKIGDVVENFLAFGLGTAALILLFMLLWGVFQWITSAGEKGSLDQAKTRMTTSVIGFILLASIWAIYTIITNLTYTP